MTFITVIRLEIERLEQLIAAAKGADAQLVVLRGTLEMLQDIENGKAAPSEPKPLVPRHPESTEIERKEQIGARVFNEAFGEEMKAIIDAPLPAAPEPPEAPIVEVDLPITKPAPGRPDEAVCDLEDLSNLPDEVKAELSVAPKAGPVTAKPNSYLDASTLPPVTPRQAATFDAVWKLFSAGGAVTAMAVGAEIKDRQGANDTLQALHLKGYIKRFPNTFPARYQPIAQGIPSKGIAPQPAKPNGNAVVAHADRGHLQNDPPKGRSALDRKRDIQELNPVSFLANKGHQCRKVTSDLYVLDGKTVPLKRLLEEINRYRNRADLPPLDLERYL